jgi:hypothetical protein
MAAASAASTSTLLCDIVDNVSLAKRVIRNRDGKGSETHIYVVNTAQPHQTRLSFLLGDADKGRYARVVRKPGTFQDSGQGAITMLVACEGEDAEALRKLQTRVVDGMKEFGLLNASISSHPDVVKLVMSPIVLESESSVMIGSNLTDDTEYYMKITKGPHAGKFMPIRMEDIRVGDRIVISLRLDRHRDKPKHRFTRYTQRVFVIDRSAHGKESTVVGSSGKTVDVIEFDPSLLDDSDSAPARPPAAAEAEDDGAGAGAAAAADDEDDEFASALKRARTGGM